MLHGATPATSPTWSTCPSSSCAPSSCNGTGVFTRPTLKLLRQLDGDASTLSRDATRVGVLLLLKASASGCRDFELRMPRTRNWSEQF
ncbi:hypothetical protein [Streptomyces caniferus]|uniref:hypothetical protein n=1 Tax=Streptomyces caniferus TaxID=285557 RepID=UPI00382AE2A6